MRSQICLTGQCPLNCGYANSSEYSQCDQVCVLKPCAALNCKTSSCVQRCLSGACNSLACSSGDCTQTCLGNCTDVNCTVTAKCFQQCEMGYCGMHAIGGGVVEQTCAENCGMECSEGMWNLLKYCFFAQLLNSQEMSWEPTERTLAHIQGLNVINNNN